MWCTTEVKCYVCGYKAVYVYDFNLTKMSNNVCSKCKNFTITFYDSLMWKLFLSKEVINKIKGFNK